MRNMPGRGRAPLAGLKRRWPVERTNGWLTNFPATQDQLGPHHRTPTRRTPVRLAIPMIYRIVDHLNTNHLPLDTIR